jgi:hypothetical protein
VKEIRDTQGSAAMAHVDHSSRGFGRDDRHGKGGHDRDHGGHDRDRDGDDRDGGGRDE